MAAASAPLPVDRPRTRALLAGWAAATAVAVVIVVVVVGPHLPPGNLSVESRDQRRINTLLLALSMPVLLGVWGYLVFALRSFRHRGETIVDGPPIMGNDRLQIAWVAATSSIVIALAAFGTIELVGASEAGAGGGQGPNPLASPPNARSALQVQVIAQQWAFTFRYPGAGAVETDQLALPAGRVTELHVTSLDVAHSFWAYELGVKADAIPGNDNVVFVRPRHTGTFTIRCAELCGVWHGHMHSTGVVLAPRAFDAWLARQRTTNAPATNTLPPYRLHYFPDPIRRAG
jgi:cytochrome c oxidase subunit II